MKPSLDVPCCIFWLWIICLEVTNFVSGFPSANNNFEDDDGTYVEIRRGKWGNENGGRKSYAGYKLLRTKPIHPEYISVLTDLDDLHGVDFWTYPLENRTLDIFTSPKHFSRVQEVLNEIGLGHDVLIHDAEELTKYEQPPQAEELIWEEGDLVNRTDSEDYYQIPPAAGLPRAASQNFFSKYQRYVDIMNFCSQLAREYPSIVGFSSIGKSYEGRDIGIMKISTGGRKPAIFIDGGMHAREWISPATVTYIMYRLVKDPNAKPLLDMFDWYIVPIVNVDGYEYTHTTDRYWRKTRSRGPNGCMGVDPNRNFGYHWAESGSSSKPCSDIYHGPRAFSEAETKALARTLMYLKNQVKLYLTLHAYSQMFLVPWGYSKHEKPNDYNELMRMGQVGRRALERTYGTQYSLGTAPDLLYPAAGGSDDWAKGAAGIPYAYCIELRDKGRYGFALPPNQIKPTGEETFNGVAALAKELYRTLKRQRKGVDVSNNVHRRQ